MRIAFKWPPRKLGSQDKEYLNVALLKYESEHKTTFRVCKFSNQDNDQQQSPIKPDRSLGQKEK